MVRKFSNTHEYCQTLDNYFFESMLYFASSSSTIRCLTTLHMLSAASLAIQQIMRIMILPILIRDIECLLTQILLGDEAIARLIESKSSFFFFFS